MHNNYPKPIKDQVSPTRCRLALGLLGMYLSILGLLLLHNLLDEHLHYERQTCCQTALGRAERHYHSTQDDCALPEHALAPSLVVQALYIKAPREQYFERPYRSSREVIEARAWRFYLLRAPPQYLL